MSFFKRHQPTPAHVLADLERVRREQQARDDRWAAGRAQRVLDQQLVNAKGFPRFTSPAESVAVLAAVGQR